MNVSRIFFVLALLCTALAVQAQREDVNLNFGWKFAPGDHPEAVKSTFDDSSWRTVNVPHDFQIHQEWIAPDADERPDYNNPMANISSRLSARGFKEMGCGWYRKVVAVPAEWQGRRVLLDFEGIMLVGDVWLNGERIGGTDYGYLGFEVDVTRKLNYGKENIIAVRADTRETDNSRWYTGGGLYRDVRFRLTDPKSYFTRHALHIETPVAGEDRSLLKVGAEMATFMRSDSVEVGLTLCDAENNVIYNVRKKHWMNARQKVREYELDSVWVDNTRLWSCESPYLYTLEAALYRPDGTVADVVRKRFGFRTLDFSPDFGMKLNGKKVLLKGIANHHTLGALGAAAYPRAIRKRLELLKEFGFNHIRTSHNPYSESLLDMCDEMGILVVDEIYDKWTRQFCGGRTEWMERWQTDIPEWVKRDRNHPCVVMWSLGNELQLIPDLPFNDWGVTPYRLQKQLLNRYDTGRPVTVAMHPRGRNEQTDSLPAPLVMVTDVASYNYRYMYFPGDSRLFPWMMFYQSEANTSDLGPNYFNMDLDRVIGLAYWGMIDYLGESHGWPAKGWTRGVFDISLEPKPGAYFVKSFFKADEPMVHIAPFTTEKVTQWNGVAMGGKRFADSWNFLKGERIQLYTYTNADEVELFLNGKSLGRKRNNTQDVKVRNRIHWDSIVYRPGKIEAVAYNDGQARPVARHGLQTHGVATKLKLTADNNVWMADGADLQHVKIEAVDRKGHCDRSAGALLTFHVEGEAEVVGVINGDMTSNELTVGDKRSLYHGTATVILRSSRNAGEVELRVESEVFPTVTVKYNTLQP